MAKIIIDVKNCKGCPHHMETLYQTNDSFERPHYWWCKHPDNVDVITHNKHNEEVRLKLLALNAPITQLKFIAGYVEWNDTIKIPNWCLIKIK